MQWHQFNKAIVACLDQVKGGAKLARYCGAMADMIMVSEKFYLPRAYDIVKGRDIDDDLRRAVNLPFGVVSLLTTDEWNRPSVIVAFHPSEFDGKWREEGGQEQDGRTLIVAFVPWDEAFEWIPYPIFFQVRFDEVGFRCGPILDKMNKEESELMREVIDGGKFNGEEIANFIAGNVFGLCMMLTLKNVQPNVIKAPKFINSKRQKRGQLPLYSYHVLSVDGEVWDRADLGGDGHGVRSHYRRGHIRRITAERHVWVRATFVKGSVPGFVEKEYDVKPRASQ